MQGLRRILGVKAAYISRISHHDVRRMAKAKRLQTYTFSQLLQRRRLRLLGHLIRSPIHDLARSLVFHHSHKLRQLNIRRTVGKPRLDWALMTMIEANIRTKALRGYKVIRGSLPHPVDRPLILPPPPTALAASTFVDDPLGLKFNSLFREVQEEALDRNNWNRMSK